MGQTNLQKIQSSIVDLQQTKQITPEQSKKFFAQYISTGEKVKDINQFMENPSVDLFLKYFINTIYVNANTRLSENSLNTTRNRKSFYTQIEDISKIFKSKIKHKFRASINDIKEINLNMHFTQMILRQKFRNMLISLLELQSFHLIKVHLIKKKAKVINSKILYFYDLDINLSRWPLIFQPENEEQTLQPEDKKRRNNELLMEIFGIKHSIDEDKYVIVPVTVSNKERYIMIYELDINKWRGEVVNDILQQNQQLFTMLTKKIALGIKNIYVNDKTKTNIRIKRDGSKSILDILELSILIDEKKFDKEKEIIREDQQLKPNKAFNSEVLEFRTNFTEIISKIRIYKKELNKEDFGYLDFDQYGFLTFLYTDRPEHKAMQYFLSFLNEKQQKILKVFQHQKKIIRYINLASNGIFKSREIMIDKSLNIRFNQDNKGRLSSISVFCNFEKDLQINLQRQRHLLINRLCNKEDINGTGWMKELLNKQPAAKKTFLTSKKQDQKISMPFLKNQLTIDELKQQINFEDQTINLLEYDAKKLIKFTLKLFCRLNFFQTLPHSNDEFPSFLNDLYQNYQKNKNSFHNFTHGVNVMHVSYLFCICAKNKSILDDFQIFVTVFSALCHDVGHTGYTNSFEVAQESDIAVRYNYQSPLQNFHASETFQILRIPRNNFLHSLSSAQFKQFRKILISNILSTDIKEHFGLMKKFEELTSKTCQNGEEQKNLLTNMIVHASDFAGSVKKFDLCRAWSQKVNAEFEKQYRQEQRLGLQKTAFMKDLNNIAVLAKNQAGFLKIIVQPLFKTLSNFYPNEKRISQMFKNSKINMDKWEEIAKKSIKDIIKSTKNEHLSNLGTSSKISLKTIKKNKMI